MKKIKEISKLVLASGGVVLTGCAELHTDSYKENKIENNEVATDIDKSMKNTVSDVQSGVRVDDIFVDLQPVVVPKNRGEDLPEFLPKTIDFLEAKPITERELKKRLLLEYGLNVVINRVIKTQDEKDAELNGSVNSNSGVQDGSTLPTLNYDGVGIGMEGENAPTEEELSAIEKKNKNLGTEFNESATQEELEENYVRPIDYSGDLAGFLDILATDRGLSWRYNNDTNEFILYDLDTKLFQLIDNTEKSVNEISVSTEAKSDASTDEGGATNGSSSKQSFSETATAEHWKSIEATVNAMLSKDGQASFDLKNGNVIVTDSKIVLDKVGRIVDQLNSASGTMVYMDVRYVKIKKSKESKVGFNFSASDLLSFAGGSTTAGLTTNYSMDDMQSIMTMDFTKANIQTMITSLQKYSSSKVDAEIPVSTRNNIPNTYQTVVEESYVSKIEVEEDDEGNTTMTPTTSINKTGLLSIFTPRVFQDKVIVSGAITISDNISMEEKEELGYVTLVTNEGRSQKIDMIIPNGVSKIASIKRISKNEAATSGPAGENSMLAGGDEDTSNEESLELIVVTPYIIH